MENLLHDLKNPSILDIKIGQQPIIPETAVKKPLYFESNKHTSSASHGFRIAGHILWDCDGKVTSESHKRLNFNYSEEVNHISRFFDRNQEYMK